MISHCNVNSSVIQPFACMCTTTPVILSSTLCPST
jgi:hypothetical protein